MPAYVKSHSQGEYVFDHGWADAWERAGGDYYPKLQIAVPFTPVPGPRLLAREPASRPALIARGGGSGRGQNGLSSAHATFIAPEQMPLFEAGRLADPRRHASSTGRMTGYASFEDFLAALARRKRKAIRKERARRVEGLTIVHVTGSAITEAHWDAFWAFYQDTGSRKWGRPYLTRAFFSLLGERMADRRAADPRAARRPADRRRAQHDRRRHALRPLLGQRSRRCPSSISRSAIIRRSTPRSPAASRASKRARRASTSSPAATGRCRPSPPITSPIPASAARSPSSWRGSARRWRTRSRRSAR